MTIVTYTNRTLESCAVSSIETYIGIMLPMEPLANNMIRMIATCCTQAGRQVAESLLGIAIVYCYNW